MNSLRVLILILLSVFVVAACGQLAPESATATPSPTATASPTPTATATATVTPAATSTATPESTATPIPSVSEPPPAPITVPSSFETYRDQIFGFRVSHPPTWTIASTQSAPRLATLAGPDDVPSASVFLFYQLDVRTAADVADNLLPELLARAGFRTLDEEQITLLDGTPAFQMTYQWRSDEGVMRGAVQTVARGGQGFVVILESLEQPVQEHSEDIQAMFHSFQLEEPAPFDIPRDEALTLYFDDGPLILDPAIAQESQSIQYIMQIFSGLVSFDADLTLRPELADWSVSEDGTVYTFTLDEGAEFHDGTPVTSDDVKYSWERAANMSQISSTVGTYLNDIVGMAEVMSGEADEISGFEVVDATTFKVTIDAPKAYFLSKLAHPVAFIVDRKNVDSEEIEPGTPWWLQPNGTGPFKLRAWEPRLVLVLDANENYVGTPPAVPHVVFRLFGGIPTLMYETGEIDVARVFADQLDEIRDPRDPLSGDLIENPELSIFYVGLASDRPPFDDPMVRKAFMLAVEREKLTRDIFGDYQPVAHGFMPPGLPGYNDSIEDIPFDPVEARRLLAASSYGGPEGLPNIIYTTSGFTEPSSPVVIGLLDMWRENLGVEVQVRLMDPDFYFYVLQQAVDNIFDYGWIADYPDPHNFLDVLFHSGTENNPGRYSNDEVDTLLETARVEQDSQARFLIYQQVEALLVDDAVAIPLRFGRDYMLVKPYLRDMVFTPFGMIDLRAVSLASE